MSGAVKYDKGKIDLTLIPVEAVYAIARVQEFGTIKYARDGWKRVPDGQNRYLSAALRHLMLHLAGQTIDGETQLAHLDQALCNLAFIAALRYMDRPEAFQGYLEFTGQTLEQAKARIAEYKVKS